MPRGGKIKFTSFRSEFFEMEVSDIGNWRIRCAQSLSTTKWIFDMDEYKRLKRIWRKKKLQFDEECKKMKFIDLFNREEFA